MAFARRRAGDLSSVNGAHGFFHSAGFGIARNLAVFLAVLFWLALGFWVFKDARRRIADPLLVLFATLLGLVPPYVGPIVYLLFRPAETLADTRSQRAELRALEQQVSRSRPACPVCSTAVEADYLACPVCTTTLREPCARCDAPLEPLWQICPYCLCPVRPAQIDLDAALTAEVRMTTFDDAGPLLPGNAPSVADA